MALGPSARTPTPCWELRPERTGKRAPCPRDLLGRAISMAPPGPAGALILSLSPVFSASSHMQARVKMVPRKCSLNVRPDGFRVKSG